MKKLIALTVVALFTTATFAQETKTEKKAEANTAKSTSHECYMMKDGTLMHCMGDKTEALKKPVTLKNGTVISPTGEVKMKDGKDSKLQNGQCISLMGSVGDCEKMNSTMTKNKAELEKTKPVKAGEEVK